MPLKRIRQEQRGLEERRNLAYCVYLIVRLERIQLPRPSSVPAEPGRQRRMRAALQHGRLRIRRQVGPTCRQIVKRRRLLFGQRMPRPVRAHGLLRHTTHLARFSVQKTSGSRDFHLYGAGTLISLTHRIGDGWCDNGTAVQNVPCSFDGGDCCATTCVDGTFACGINGFDCEDPSICDPARVGNGGSVQESRGISGFPRPARRFSEAFEPRVYFQSSKNSRF